MFTIKIIVKKKSCSYPYPWYFFLLFFSNFIKVFFLQSYERASHCAMTAITQRSYLYIIEVSTRYFIFFEMLLSLPVVPFFQKIVNFELHKTFYQRYILKYNTQYNNQHISTYINILIICLYDEISFFHHAPIPTRGTFFAKKSNI